MTTIVDVKSQFNTDNVKQAGSKQLFVVNDNTLVSYRTIVGKLIDGTWYITTEKYSVTTTRQCNQFANEAIREATRKGFKVERVTELP